MHQCNVYVGCIFNTDDYYVGCIFDTDDSIFFGLELISCCSNLRCRNIVDSTPLKLAVFFLALPFGVLSPVLRTGNLGDDISSMKSKSDFSSVLNKNTNGIDTIERK